MQHTVLARKWRPKKFADLVGQAQSVTILKNIITRQRYHHAYLLTGTRGVGKTTIARIIAKALNCLDLKAGEPCGSCTNCMQIDLGRFVDVIEIDAASNTGVDNVRELIEDAKYSPTSGNYKVYIIDEVHMLSKSAFNAMLKTLEEPPSHAIFILATTDLQKVPVTILSRCLQLKLRNLLPVEIEEHLAHVLNAEGVRFEPESLVLLAKAANGSMRDGLSILDQAIAFTNDVITVKEVETMLGVSNDEVIYAVLDALCTKDGGQLVTLAHEIYQRGDAVAGVLESLRDKLCQVSLLQLALTADAKLQKYAQQMSVNDVQLYFEIANLGLEQLSRQSDKQPIFVMTLLRMLAFRIGSDSEKEIAITKSNFMAASSNKNAVSAKNELPLPSDLHVGKKPPEAAVASSMVALESDAMVAPSVADLTTEFCVGGVEQLANENNLGKFESDVAPDLSDEQVVVLGDTGAGIVKNINPLSVNKEECRLPSMVSEVADISAAKGLIINQEDWFNLIITLKTKLNYLYPILENAELINCDDNKLIIKVDERYHSIFNNDAVHKVTVILSEHLSKNIELDVSFASDTNDTLKHKILKNHARRLELAEESIKTDPNLTKMADLFSATIIHSSIESKAKEE